MEIYDGVINPDFQNLLNEDFQLIKNRPSQKISPILQLAEPKDAKEITQIFKDVYHGKYPYKEMLDVQEVQNMINDPNYEWILFKVGINKIIGCFVADMDFKKKKGVMHGFIIRKNYQKIIDALMACIGSVTYIYKIYRNKILFWSAETRTNNTTAQYSGMLCGYKPIAFFPNKDIFFDHIESEVMIIAYDDKVLREYRCKEDPKIIRQVLNCYIYSNKRYHLGTPLIENPNIKFNPKKLEETKRKIDKRIKKDKFGYETITFSINNSDSYFKFAYNPYSRNFENTKYKISNLEELFVFTEELKELIQKYDVHYFECFVSAYKPTHQKLFHDAGFKPRGYVPCWEYNKKQQFFEDHIVFNYYKGNIDKNIKLIPEAIELLQTLNFFEEKLIPEPSEHLRI